MNRKIILIVLTLAFVLLATPFVYAKPTEAANSDNFPSFVWHSQGGNSVPVEGYPKVNPPGAAYQSPEQQVAHMQAVWYLNPEQSNYVKIGDGAQIPIDAATGYEGYLYVVDASISDTHKGLNYRVYEKIIWDNNYIEIKCNERGYIDLLPGPPFYTFSASGTFEGHGVIDGQKVQVTGIREGVIGATGVILDCTGTIRFLGS